MNRNGSEWTRLHKPIKVLQIYENCDDYDEDKYTKQFMAKFGIENVRGGSYTSVNLTESQKQFIQQEITGCTDKCYCCGESGHFARDSWKRYDISTSYNFNQSN